MRTTGTVILGAYTLACLAALVLGPLVILRGYRAWWLDLFYAAAVGAFISGSISHYRAARRSTRSSDLADTAGQHEPKSRRDRLGEVHGTRIRTG